MTDTNSKTLTDRDLLELAAKAAGVASVCWNAGLEPYSSGPGFVLASNRLWNPLTDDGDALRLAVKLEIEVRNFNGSSHAGKQGKFWRTEAWFPEGAPCAATRRAIVRAAAEIGKGLVPFPTVDEIRQFTGDDAAIGAAK